MKKNNMKKILHSFGKISKQWGLGESAGRIWGFLLFKSAPVTQKEIEECTNYSRGLVSRSLKKLKELDMISVTKKGKEFYYSTNVTLIEGFNKLTNNFIKSEIRPLVKSLSENLNKIENVSIKRNVRNIIKEYKKLDFGILALSKTMRDTLLNHGEYSKNHQKTSKNWKI